jgi:hypothetical protein
MSDAVQNRGDISTVPFIRAGFPFTKDNQIIAQIIGRSAPLLNNTVMGKVAASQKWLPLTNLAATNGMAIAQGIYQGPSIPAATLAASDVTGQVILVGGAGVIVDQEQLVLENSLTLNSVTTVGTTDLRTVEDHLANRGIFVEGTVDFDGFENT